METPKEIKEASPSFQFSRIIHFPGVLALGLSTFIGIGFFLSPGLIAENTIINSPLIHVVSAVLFLPLVLLFIQTSQSHSGREHIFHYGRGGLSGWMAFSSGWLTLGGYFCLGAILVWGTAVQIQQLLGNIYEINFLLNWIAAVICGYVFLINLSGIKFNWKTSSLVLFFCVLLVLGTILWIIMAVPPSGSIQLPYRSYGMLNAITLWMIPSLWGLGIIFDHRYEIHNPGQSIKKGMLVSLAIFGLLGFLAGIAVLSHTEWLAYGKVPIYAILASQSESASVIYLSAGIICCLIAFDRCFVSLSNHLVEMTQIGNMITANQNGKYFRYVPFWQYLIAAAGLVLMAIFLPIQFVFGGASILFLILSGFYSLEELIRKEKKQGASKYDLLLYGTVIPGLSLFTTIYLMSTLSTTPYELGAGWLFVGVIYYLLYGRQKLRDYRRNENIVPETSGDEGDHKHHVIAAISNPAAAPHLMRTAYNLAKANDGALSVLQVVVMPEHTPAELKKEKALSVWNTLSGMIKEAGFDPVIVKPIVHIAPAAAVGVLEAIREENADLLVLGFAEKKVLTDKYIEPVLEQVITSASCGVLVVKGPLCEELQKIVVVARDNPHDDAVVETGKSLALVTGASLKLIHLIGKEVPKDREAKIKEHLEHLFKGAEEILSRAEQEIIPTNSARETIISKAAACDLLIIGASTEGIFERAYFGGTPIEVAIERRAATILVKKDEGKSQFWLRRVWEIIYNLMPKLTKAERAEMYKIMRHSAKARIDFYVLIVLSSVIAVLGLIQNSGAVIIGAMLVAPLMSPILALGNSIIQGNLYLFLQAAESILKGVLVAIGVSFVMAILIPEQAISQEILARTQPNLLDMIVALASGAAAAYAISREELAAALPGVAISAALLPPLCVVGFGLAEAQFTIAGGALLLFATNLEAIVLAATIVFLLLGFRPLHFEFGSQARRGILITVIILVIIAMPLAYGSYVSQVRFQRIGQATQILEEFAASNDFQVEDIQVGKKNTGLEVSATFFISEDTDELLIANIQNLLRVNLKKPIFMNIRMVKTEFIKASP